VFINIQVSDELYTKYAEKAPDRPQRAMADTLKAFVDLEPGEAMVVLRAETLREVSRILGHPISTPKELLEHLTRSERVTLGEGIEVELNPGQRARLKAQAEFFKQPLEEFAKKQVAAGVVAIVGP